MLESKMITFIVTKDCQLRCRYCYLVGKNNKERMSFETASKAVDYILSEPRLCNSEAVVWDFIGGEPLLEIRLIDEIMTYIVSKTHRTKHVWSENYTIRLTTNGLLYSSGDFQAFLRKYEGHLSVNISIDGDKAKNDANRVFPNGRGSYDAIKESIALWREQFPEEGTKMTISHDDLPFVYQGLVHLVSLGIRKIDVNPVLEDVWQEGDQYVFEDQLISFADYVIDNHLWNQLMISCFEQHMGMPLEQDSIDFCGPMMLSVDAQGNFYTCLRFAQYSLREKKPRIIGNIRDGIRWNLLRPFYVYPLSVVAPKCLACPIASGCKTCPAENYDSAQTDTIYQKSLAACDIHKARVHAKNYYWNKLVMNS